MPADLSALFRKGHPEGYHKSEEARERCWGCSHPEMLEISAEDEAFARDLIAKGYKSTSNKYCSVARVWVPPFEEAIKFHDEVPEWLRGWMRRAYEQWVDYGMRCEREQVEHLELTPTQFRAFKKLGGHTA